MRQIHTRAIGWGGPWKTFTYLGRNGIRFACCHFRARKPRFSWPTPSNGPDNGCCNLPASKSLRPAPYKQQEPHINICFCNLFKNLNNLQFYFCEIWGYKKGKTKKIRIRDKHPGSATLFNPTRQTQPSFLKKIANPTHPPGSPWAPLCRLNRSCPRSAWAPSSSPSLPSS